MQTVRTFHQCTNPRGCPVVEFRVQLGDFRQLNTGHLQFKSIGWLAWPQVCIVDDTWLVGKPEQANVRVDRCITTENDELEPWFFAFRKKRSASQ